jgi:release factor glutamine methyltransferase
MTREAATGDVVARLRAAGCVFAEEEALLLVGAASTEADLEAMVAERVAGLPLQHVLGWADFCGQRVAVDRGVFVPRPRTELLVREAVARARPGDRVVDLCCGSGAVGVALAAAVGPLELHAADVDPAAVRCARRNLAAAGGRAYEGDLFDALPTGLRGRVDLVVANAPYVPADAVALMPAEARLHEPLVALSGGADGLDVLRRVVAGAPAWLAPGGHLLVESSEAQAPAVVEAFSDAGLTAQLARSDELEATVVVGTVTAG